MSNDKLAATTDTFKQKLVRMVRELPDETLLALATQRLGGGQALVPSGVQAEVTLVSDAGVNGEGISGPGVTDMSDEALLALVTQRLGGGAGKPIPEELGNLTVSAAQAGVTPPSEVWMGDGEGISGPGVTDMSDETLLALVTQRLITYASAVE